MLELVQDDGTESMPEATILAALEATRSRISRAQAQRAELERAIASAQEEEQLLEKLLALRRGEGETLAVVQQAEGFSQTPENPARGLNHPVVLAVLEELEQAGRPLHISELMRLLHNRKVPIPGLGAQANVISYLRRDKRLVRPSRGMYGLAVWGLEDMSIQARSRRRRRRMRSAAKGGEKQS